MNADKSNVLVTGAAGYVGRHLVKHLLDLHHNVTAIARSQSLDNEPLPCRTATLDLTDAHELSKLLQDIRPQVVVNLAAFATLGECEIQRSRAVADNVVSVRNLTAQLVRHAPDSRLIHVSTDMVFNGIKGEYCEEDDPRPISWYGHTKLEGEKVALASKLNTVVLRSALIFGPSIGPKKSFLSWAVQAIKCGNGAFFTDEIRTPCFIGDLLTAIVRMASADVSGVFHVAGRERLTRFQFAERVKDAFNFEEPVKASMIHTALDARLRPKDLSLKISKLSSTIGFIPTPLQDALAVSREKGV